MSKVLMVPADVFDQLKAEGARIYDPDAPLTNDVRVPLLRDNWGACKPGHGFKIDEELLRPLRLGPMSFPVVPVNPGRLDLGLSMFRAMEMALPKPPPFLGLLNMPLSEPPVFVGEPSRLTIGIDWAAYQTPAKDRLRRQRRLDRWSNVRRRKRAAELARRRDRG